MKGRLTGDNVPCCFGRTLGCGLSEDEIHYLRRLRREAFGSCRSRSWQLVQLRVAPSARNSMVRCRRLFAGKRKQAAWHDSGRTIKHNYLILKYTLTGEVYSDILYLHDLRVLKAKSHISTERRNDLVHYIRHPSGAYGSNYSVTPSGKGQLRLPD